MSSDAAYFPEAFTGAADLLEAASATLDDLRRSVDADGEGQSGAPSFAGPTPDVLLIQQVSAGSKDALGLLLGRYSRAVRRAASRILRDEAEADDLVQEVFLAVWQNAGSFNPERGKVSTWIIHLAYSRALDRRRYLKARHFYEAVDLDENALRMPDRSREAGFGSDSLLAVLGKDGMARFRSELSAEQQETLQLFFFEGYALKEIAELTGRSLVNVRSYYYRGLEKLRQLVPGYGA